MIRRRGVPVWLAAGLDAVLVLVFAAIGRASHAEKSPVVDAVVTAWPFLVGAGAGWALVVMLRRSPLRPAQAWPIWIAAVAVGMVLRALTGRGVAPSFVVVATIVLGVFLMGWRVLVGLVWRRRQS